MKKFYYMKWHFCTKLQLPPEPLTRGLPPRSLCPLSSTEFVETPPQKKKIPGYATAITLRTLLFSRWSPCTASVLLSMTCSWFDNLIRCTILRWGFFFSKISSGYAFCYIFDLHLNEELKYGEFVREFFSPTLFKRKMCLHCNKCPHFISACAECVYGYFRYAVREV